MKFSEMKEMTFGDWNGTPFEAYRTNNCDVTCDDLKTEIVGYISGKWVSKNGIEWLYVYPVDLNKEEPKRMTNRQLAMWLGKGNGEWTTSGLVCSQVNYTYDKDYANEFVTESIRVRKWDSEEWIEPTVDLI